jgi:hypothetical protein
MNLVDPPFQELFDIARLDGLVGPDKEVLPVNKDRTVENHSWLDFM